MYKAGISYAEFGKLNMKQMRHIAKAYQEKLENDFRIADTIAFIQGRYTVDALLCTVGNMFGGKNTKFSYPEQSYSMASVKKELTEEDVKRILEASKGSHYHIGFQLAVLAMRRSEICAATIDDLHGNLLTINKDRIYDENNHLMTRDNTKTEESTREIYLPDSLVAEIREAGYIYDRTPPMLVKTLHKYQDELEIPRFRLHDLRVFFVSYAHSLKIPDLYIQKAGGWKSDFVMKNTYLKELKDKTQEAQQNIASKLF